MIWINGQWETTDTLQDCIKIVDEHLSPELAQRITEWYHHYQLEYDDLKSDYKTTEDLYDESQDELREAHDKVTEYKRIIDYIKYEINELENKLKI